MSKARREVALKSLENQIKCLKDQLSQATEKDPYQKRLAKCQAEMAILMERLDRKPITFAT